MSLSRRSTTLAVVVAVVAVGLAVGLGFGLGGSSPATSKLATSTSTSTSTSSTAAPATSTTTAASSSTSTTATTAPATTTTTTAGTVPGTGVTATTVPPPPSTVQGGASQGLATIVAGLGPDHASSGPVTADGATWAAVSYDAGGTQAMVSVYRYGAGSWVKQADVALSADGGVGQISSSADSTTPVTAASLTPSPAPDFVVVTEGASASVTSVVSDATGTWSAVPFAGPYGTVIAVPFGVVSGSEIRASFNNCVPNCAEGTTTSQLFRYAAGTFQPVGG